jgi:hypothetical protein
MGKEQEGKRLNRKEDEKTDKTLREQGFSWCKGMSM